MLQHCAFVEQLLDRGVHAPVPASVTQLTPLHARLQHWLLKLHDDPTAPHNGWQVLSDAQASPEQQFAEVVQNAFCPLQVPASDRHWNVLLLQLFEQH